MAGSDGESQNIKDLALEFLQNGGIKEETPTAVEDDEDLEEEVEKEEVEDETSSDHPAWKAILDKVPEEYWDEIRPQLQEWDTGVNRRFQKIHDEYEPLRAFEGQDPETAQKALDFYQMLIEDPATTHETIGKVFGLSPQDSQSGSPLGEDFDDLDLPQPLLDKLALIDTHDSRLSALQGEIQRRDELAAEEEGEIELDEYLEELQEEFGDFDEDFVISLMAVGVDGDEAVQRFQEYFNMEEQQESAPEPVAKSKRKAPQVMSDKGGVPSEASGSFDYSKVKDQDTKDLVTQILSQTNK